MSKKLFVAALLATVAGGLLAGGISIANETRNETYDQSKKKKKRTGSTRGSGSGE